jgi:trans-2,3-dihydro-3-hydroxyanthranilate isomerase
MFALAMGMEEDPATGGAAAAALASYLGRRRGDRSPRWLVGQGVEMGRPSLIEVEADAGVGGEGEMEAPASR